MALGVRSEFPTDELELKVDPVIICRVISFLLFSLWPMCRINIRSLCHPLL